jgi:hypothetical protein
MTSDGASIQLAVGKSRQRESVVRWRGTRVTVGDHLGIVRGTATSLLGMDPEPEVSGRGDESDPDLDALARDLAEVEAELDRLADGTAGDVDGDVQRGPAAP